MRIFWGTVVGLILLPAGIGAQSLGDLARQEREKKAKEQKSGVVVTTDQLQKGQVDLSPPLDPARKGDLEYLLQQVSHPRVSPELLTAFIPLKGQAIPKLVGLLESPEPLKRVGPGTTLIALGNTEGLASMARLLGDATQPAPAPAPQASSEQPASSAASAPNDEAFRQKVELTREADYALSVTKFGVWRFIEGSALTPEQVVARLEKGPAIEIVGGADNGQRLFNRALHDNDPNIRLGAIALVRVAADGNDFGYRADLPPAQNQAAIQEITTFLATQRAKVVSELATKTK